MWCPSPPVLKKRGVHAFRAFAACLRVHAVGRPGRRGHPLFVQQPSLDRSGGRRLPGRPPGHHRVGCPRRHRCFDEAPARREGFAPRRCLLVGWFCDPRRQPGPLRALPRLGRFRGRFGSGWTRLPVARNQRPTSWCSWSTPTPSAPCRHRPAGRIFSTPNTRARSPSPTRRSRRRPMRRSTASRPRSARTG